jgi:hypothetical protein
MDALNRSAKDISSINSSQSLQVHSKDTLVADPRLLTYM